MPPWAWTEALNAQLNQCVFECGYDFTAAAALLGRRAEQSRLISTEDLQELTSDACQVQWMAINPVLDDDDEELELEPEFHFYQPLDPAASLASPAATPVATETPLCEPYDYPENKEMAQEPVLQSVAVPEGCPTLELSLSEAELDSLLNSLPQNEQTCRYEAVPGVQYVSPELGSLDDKQPPVSEMQWVLSFLTDPEAAAHRDAEAKNLLRATMDRSEDDNYQFFLQEMNHANLLATISAEREPALSQLPLPPPRAQSKPNSVCAVTPLPPFASSQAMVALTPATVASTPVTDVSNRQGEEHGRHDVAANNDSDSSSDSDEGNWALARQQIKLKPTLTASRPPRAATEQSHPNNADRRDVSVRYMAPSPPRRLAPVHHTNENDHHTISTVTDSGMTCCSPSTETAKRAVLSRTIGDELRKRGEFQFPKDLFTANADA